MTTSNPVANHEPPDDEPARASRARLQYTSLGDVPIPEAATSPAEVIEELRHAAKNLRGLADEFSPFWHAFANQLDEIADREQEHEARAAADGHLIGAPEPGEDIYMALELLRVWRACI